MLGLVVFVPHTPTSLEQSAYAISALSAFEDFLG